MGKGGEDVLGMPMNRACGEERRRCIRNACEQGHVGKGGDVLGMPVIRGMWGRERMDGLGMPVSKIRTRTLRFMTH